MKRNEVLARYGLTEVDYSALVWFGEKPNYMKEIKIGDRWDMVLHECAFKLIEKGFFTYDRLSKRMELTNKGREVWNLEEEDFYGEK